MYINQEYVIKKTTTKQTGKQLSICMCKRTVLKPGMNQSYLSLAFWIWRGDEGPRGGGSWGAGVCPTLLKLCSWTIFNSGGSLMTNFTLLKQENMWRRAASSESLSPVTGSVLLSHMSDHRMALLPFSTLATYVPDGDHDTALMAELQMRREVKIRPSTNQYKRHMIGWEQPCGCRSLLTCGSDPEFCPHFLLKHSTHTALHQPSLLPHSCRLDWNMKGRCHMTTDAHNWTNV